MVGRAISIKDCPSIHLLRMCKECLFCACGQTVALEQSLERALKLQGPEFLQATLPPHPAPCRAVPQRYPKDPHSLGRWDLERLVFQRPVAS